MDIVVFNDSQWLQVCAHLASYHSLRLFKSWCCVSFLCNLPRSIHMEQAQCGSFTYNTQLEKGVVQKAPPCSDVYDIVKKPYLLS